MLSELSGAGVINCPRRSHKEMKWAEGVHVVELDIVTKKVSFNRGFIFHLVFENGKEKIQGREQRAHRFVDAWHPATSFSR